MTVSTREAMARQLWLSYFNRVLHQQGIITPKEYHKMSRKICSRTI